MNYDQNVFINQVPLVDMFVKHIIYHRALRNILPEAMFDVSFWVLTSDAYLLQASIYWCMVFGSEGTNKTHWKKLSKDKLKCLTDSFRDGLVSNIGITHDEYHKYWKKMTDFRNNYSAHRALEFSNPVPDFELALDIAFYYDRWIRELIRPDRWDGKRLSILVEEYKHQAVAEITSIVKAVQAKQDAKEGGLPSPVTT